MLLSATTYYILLHSTTYDSTRREQAATAGDRRPLDMYIYIYIYI